VLIGLRPGKPVEDVSGCGFFPRGVAGVMLIDWRVETFVARLKDLGS
jgi:hypothetical protein